MSGEIVDNTGEENETPEPEEVEQVEDESVEAAEEDSEESEESEVTEDETETEEEQPETENYKEAFKKHPELRKAFFEYNQYTQVFPTPKDAQEAYEQVQTFQDFTQAVDSGDINPVIQAVIDSNPQAFSTFAENFLPNLRAMDQRLFDRALAPSVAELLRSAQAAGQKNQNKNLYLAAQHLSNWLFNTENPPDIKPSAQVQPRSDGSVQQRSQEFFKELDDEIGGFLNNEASRALDPNNVLPPSLRKATISDIIEEAVKIMKSDPAAQAALKIARDKAARSGFSYEARKGLRDLYMTKMKPIIARLKGAKREEAMKSIGKNVPSLTKKKILPSGSSTGTGNRRPVDPKKVDASRTSMRDALDGNFVLKGQK